MYLLVSCPSFAGWDKRAGGPHVVCLSKFDDHHVMTSESGCKVYCCWVLLLHDTLADIIASIFCQERWHSVFGVPCWSYFDPSRLFACSMRSAQALPDSWPTVSASFWGSLYQWSMCWLHDTIYPKGVTLCDTTWLLVRPLHDTMHDLIEAMMRHR